MGAEKYRTGLKRLWAAFIDGTIFLPLLFVEHWIYRNTANVWVLFISTTFVLVAPFIYSIILHHTHGQTLGKWVAGVKVVDITETRKITLRQSIFRDGFYLIVTLTGLIYYSLLLTRTDDKASILTDYSGFFGDSVFIWWTLIELITMLTNSRQRALHDYIAKSIVVRTGSSG